MILKGKKCVAEKGHSDRLKMYVGPNKIYVDPGIRTFLLNGLIHLAELLYFAIQDRRRLLLLKIAET